jgi:hypothetical protein
VIGSMSHHSQCALRMRVATERAQKTSPPFSPFDDPQATTAGALTVPAPPEDADSDDSLTDFSKGDRNW